MKKPILVILLAIALSLPALAGGLLTNSNQSAQFVRMLSRNASTQIDAVYFNPAGLTQLENGWHFALHNQSIFQEKTVNSDFPLLNDGEYIGKVKAPVFPSGFAVYKNEAWAFSLGFGPNAGGGSADFDRGLPSFEIPISKVVPGLAGLKALGYNVTGYDTKITFEGTSVFWGIQAGATYKVNDILSVYGGVRYMPSTNTYAGSIKDIMVTVNGNQVKAAEFLPSVGNAVKAMATQASGAAASAQQLITGGAGNFTLTQVQTAGYITSTQKAQFEAGLAGFGLTPAQIAAMNMTQIKGAFDTGAASLNTQGNALIANGAKLADKEVDTKQTGAGITPMVGINITPAENLNFAVRYEHMTGLKLTNDTKVDDTGLFENGEEVTSDIPAILAAGIGYKPLDWLQTQLSYSVYFDKGVSWGNNVREIAAHSRQVSREIDKNYYELALGLQFKLSDAVDFSVGAMTSQPGTADSYQSDFSYSNPSYTLAGGLQWKVTNQLTFDAGLMNTFYKDEVIPYADTDIPGGKYSDTLGKTTMGFAFGLSYSIF